jgi:hypothetical protein
LKEREEAELRGRIEQDEKEKQRIQEELKLRKLNAKEFAENLNEKLKSFPEPIQISKKLQLARPVSDTTT